MPVEIRPIGPGDLEAYIRAFNAAFVETTAQDELQGWQRTWERTGIIERAIAAMTAGGLSAPPPPSLSS